VTIAVVGAGAMGAIFGGRLAEHGADVILIGIDDARLAAIARERLRIATTPAIGGVALRAAARAAALHEPVAARYRVHQEPHTGAAIESVRHLIGPSDLGPHPAERPRQIPRRSPRWLPPARIAIGGQPTYRPISYGLAHVRSHGSGTTRGAVVDGRRRLAAAARDRGATRRRLPGCAATGQPRHRHRHLGEGRVQRRAQRPGGDHAPGRSAARQRARPRDRDPAVVDEPWPEPRRPAASPSSARASWPRSAFRACPAPRHTAVDAAGRARRPGRPRSTSSTAPSARRRTRRPRRTGQPHAAAADSACSRAARRSAQSKIISPRAQRGDG